jgi:hypothetical protein
MAYIGNSPGVSSQRIVSTFTATSGQTTFTPSSGYTVGYVDVYLNGIKLLNGTDYTASNGATVVLAEATATDDVVEVMAYIPRGLSDGYTKAEADAKYEPIDTAYTKAEADARYMDINSVPTPAAVSDAANTSTGYFGMPTGTTAQRPGSAAAGYTRYNTTTGSLEFYDGTNWISTNLIPTINSLTGTIYAGASSTLTLSLSNATDTIDVKYYEGGTLLATDSGVTVTSGSATSTVPSAVYGQTAGDTISIQIFNQDGTPSSNNISKTVVGLPTGGTITTTGSYRVHTFTASSSFVVPSGLSLSNVEYLVVAGGGGGGGFIGGGAGAGGYRSSVTGESSGGGASAESKLSLSAGSYTVTVGAGASGYDGFEGPGGKGNNSVFGSITSNGGGGGRGGGGSPPAGYSDGGSGGGGGHDGSDPGGSGTAGQGYAGGSLGARTSPYYNGGGGGGAGQIGQTATSAVGGAGGAGVQSSINGTATYRAGGGGGGYYSTADNPSSGGIGGGGNGGKSSVSSAGTANTGGGGGTTKNGGSGIVIVRYQLS